METCRETDFSTQPPCAQAPPWFSHAHGDEKRPQDPGPAPLARPQEAVSLSQTGNIAHVCTQVVQAGDGVREPANAGVAVEGLLRRADFLHAQGGRKAVRDGFILRARTRKGHAGQVARTGLTVSRKAGGAVQRNRIKRRLRAALAQTAPGRVHAGFDYVVIARSTALSLPFTTLTRDLESAISSVHRDTRASRPAPTKSSK